jgi:nucleotide-binding universal stress UspA family protein
MTMKVLFATDGSDLALQAQSLIASIPWPADTSILVLHVIPLSGLFGSSTAAHGHLRRAVDHELETTRQALAGPGRQVDSVVKVGRPASTIVDDAREIEADLVVLGSRGHGAVVSALLGSVAAEVVDYAPCPVLVARSDRLTGVVLAHDGSPGASQAEAVLLTMPFLRSLPIRVVSAWNVPLTHIGDPTGAPAISGDLYDALVRDARTYAEGVAVDAAARLKSAGLTAVAQVAEGSAADAISRSAGTTDLIAMGTRGQTGLARLLLGSVARSILHRANSSVLFVPQAAARP